MISIPHFGICSAKIFAIVVLSLCLAGTTALALAQSKPNIVFILADDLGWSDLACYANAWHSTPQLDRLAEQGKRFTNAYSPAPICSASRAAILTGKTPARLGFEFVTKEKAGRQDGAHPLLSPPFTLNLPLEELTLAEVLAPAGYQTGFFGKWHLNQHYKGYLGWSPTHGPLTQGYAHGNSEFGSHPYEYLKRDGSNFGDFNSNEFPSDALIDKAISFLEANRNEPFFLHLSQYYVHDPIHTRVKWLKEKYREKMPAGTSDERLAYAAMVETLDQLVGRILDAVDELGLSQNTIVVFTSDNGGHPNYSANAPWRGSKWNLYEGGIRVPLIVRWPGVIEPGSSSAEPVTGCDLFPTFCELAGAAPDDIERDGMSLIPILKGEPRTASPRPLVWHFPYYHPETGFNKAPSTIGVNDFVTSQTRPHSTIRLGRHKLIHFYEDIRDELYDLESDTREKHDLANAEQKLVHSLRQKLDNYLNRVNARLPEVNIK